MATNVKFKSEGKSWAGNGFGYYNNWTATLTSGEVVGQYRTSTGYDAGGWALINGERQSFNIYPFRVWKQTLADVYQQESEVSR